MKYYIALLLVAFVSGNKGDNHPEIPERYATEMDDSLMRLLINRGFAKEKEDNIDKKCGCECDCCQKRNSQYWINR